MKPIHYFIRHGQTLWNAERRFQGRTEVDLDETGRAQALRNGRRMAQILENPGNLSFISSPQSRARQTMEILRQALGLPPLDYGTDSRLVELDYGDWQGLTEKETASAFPELFARRNADKWNFVPPGRQAESYAMQAVRLSPFMESLERPSICVAHGGILRCVLVLVAGHDPQKAAAMEIPQDRILRLEDGKAEWL